MLTLCLCHWGYSDGFSSRRMSNEMSPLELQHSVREANMTQSVKVPGQYYTLDRLKFLFRCALWSPSRLRLSPESLRKETKCSASGTEDAWAREPNYLCAELSNVKNLRLKATTRTFVHSCNPLVRIKTVDRPCIWTPVRLKLWIRKALLGNTRVSNLVDTEHENKSTASPVRQR